MKRDEIRKYRGFGGDSNASGSAVRQLLERFRKISKRVQQ
jgi:hypothetical protein